MRLLLLIFALSACGASPQAAPTVDLGPGCDGGQCCALRVLRAADGGQVAKDVLAMPMGAEVCEVVCLTSGTVWSCCPGGVAPVKEDCPP